MDIAAINGRLQARAKINFRLKVVGRRADGYHLLSMLNAELGLADRIEISLRQAPGVELKIEGGAQEDEGLSDPARNLASRAAQACIERFDLGCGAEIRLMKEIPLGAGLGGGSSDAAAILRFFGQTVLPARGRPEASGAEVRNIAITLGADVPYSARGGFCRVSGIGEEIEPLDSAIVEGLPCLLVLPPIHCSTKEVFGRLAAPCARDSALEPFASAAIARSQPISRLREMLLRGLIENDLEASAFHFYPTLADLAMRLRSIEGAVAGMSGSGSSLFLLPADGETLSPDAERLARQAAAASGARIISTRVIAN